MEWTRTEKDIFRLAVFSSSSSLMCLPNEGVLGEVSIVLLLPLPLCVAGCAVAAGVWISPWWTWRRLNVRRDPNATLPSAAASCLRPTQTLILTHLLIIDIAWHTSPLCSLLSRGHSLQFWVCPGIIFLPNVLLVPALTAEPKFTASLTRIMGQWAPSVVTCLQNEPRNSWRMWDEMAPS